MPENIFKRLLRKINQRRKSCDDRVDFVQELPIEISLIILSKLDDASLFNAARVSRGWCEACKSSTKLRRRIRQRQLHIKQMEINEMIAHSMQVQDRFYRSYQFTYPLVGYSY
ncbi:uncharacterized protein LOC111693324 [Trichogramma pretiosum]|uniref:F-box domain-containing protein n=1 Tax=Trichogramma kaykai TaxID=54128 RepID=A0ABD2X968_9HYME|nr:uncharacterized protein LOC111693324 [Trichogramma pretiosum]